MCGEYYELLRKDIVFEIALVDIQIFRFAVTRVLSIAVL